MQIDGITAFDLDVLMLVIPESMQNVCLSPSGHYILMKSLV